MRGCPGCGCLVADIDLHMTVCAHLTTQDQRDRLQWGPPEDWPRKPGAPTPPIPGPPNGRPRKPGALTPPTSPPLEA